MRSHHLRAGIPVRVPAPNSAEQFKYGLNTPKLTVQARVVVDGLLSDGWLLLQKTFVLMLG
jgi:hypothetical protein